jgi:hemerythrin-like domain-containing protein
MNAIEILIGEHQEHRLLFEKFSGEKDEFQVIRDALVHHVNEEEAILYPRLLEIDRTREETAQAWKEHNRIMELLQKLDKETNGILWNALFQELKELHLRHIDEEERDLFPLVFTKASPGFLEEVGEQMVIQKVFEPTDKILYPEVPGSHQI